MIKTNNTQPEVNAYAEEAKNYPVSILLNKHSWVLIQIGIAGGYEEVSEELKAMAEAYQNELAERLS